MSRVTVESGTTWGPVVGYARAVRVGEMIVVAGTTAARPDGEVIGESDPEAQATEAIRRIEAALEELGAGLDAVVRTRIFVTDIRHWEPVGRAHGRAFGTIRPASTLVEVSRLIDDRLLVEIEADAIIEAPPAQDT
jgi:enamine deaminase RidA (YjgF/YER057c/UK114 family)